MMDFKIMAKVECYCHIFFNLSDVLLKKTINIFVQNAITYP